MITLSVVNEAFQRICTIAILEDMELNIGEEFYLAINYKKIPFKVIENGGLKTIQKTSFISDNSRKEIHALISYINSFEELRIMLT